VNVIFAIVHDVSLFLRGERWTLHDPIAHVGLVCGVDSVFAEVLQGTGERIEALLAISALDGTVVRVVAKLDVRI
jgi:hypothetical protein